MSAAVPGLWEGCCAVRQQLTSYSLHLQSLVCRDVLGQPRRKSTFSSCLSPLQTWGAALELKSELCNRKRQNMLIKISKVMRLWDTTSSLEGHIRIQNYPGKLKNCCSEWDASPWAQEQAQALHKTKRKNDWQAAISAVDVLYTEGQKRYYESIISCSLQSQQTSYLDT